MPQPARVSQKEMELIMSTPALLWQHLVDQGNVLPKLKNAKFCTMDFLRLCRYGAIFLFKETDIRYAAIKEKVSIAKLDAMLRYTLDEYQTRVANKLDITRINNLIAELKARKADREFYERYLMTLHYKSFPQQICGGPKFKDMPDQQ
jgi:hypothetical protein